MKLWREESKMSKQIIAVYQDCVLCGDKGRKKVAELAAKGIIIRKVGFTTAEGKDLIHKAVFEHKIGTMPFFTDGENFTNTLNELIEKQQKKTETTKKSKRNTKKAKVEE